MEKTTLIAAASACMRNSAHVYGSAAQIIFLNTITTPCQRPLAPHFVCNAVQSASPASRCSPHLTRSTQCSRKTPPPTTQDEANNLQPARKHLARLSQQPLLPNSEQRLQPHPTQTVLSCPLLLSHTISSAKRTNTTPTNLLSNQQTHERRFSTGPLTQDNRPPWPSLAAKTSLHRPPAASTRFSDKQVKHIS